MKLLTLEILQLLQENKNIKNNKDTMIILNECINEIIELERRYELINEVLDDRLKELEALQSKSCGNCKFKPIDGDNEKDIWEKYAQCSNCCNYYENKFNG